MRIIAIILAWLALALPCQAQMTTMGAGSSGKAGTVGPPVLAFGGNAVGNGGNNPQVLSGISIGSAAATRVILLTWTCVTNQPVTSITVTPNVGSAVTATIDAQQGSSSPIAGIGHAVLLSDANSATTVSVSFNFGSTTFVGLDGGVWYAPSAGFSSTTPTSAGTTGPLAAATTATKNLTTSANGFIIGAAVSDNITSNSGSFSGTETYTSDFNGATSGGQHVGAHATGIHASGSNAVTATFTQSGNVTLATASWR